MMWCVFVSKEEITKPGVKGALFIKSAVPGMAISVHPDYDDKSVMRNNYFTTRPGLLH